MKETNGNSLVTLRVIDMLSQLEGVHGRAGVTQIPATCLVGSCVGRAGPVGVVVKISYRPRVESDDVRTPQLIEMELAILTDWCKNASL